MKKTNSTTQSKTINSRTVIANFAASLDGLSIALCPEIGGGDTSLFDDSLPPSSWILRQSKITESGSLCLLYKQAPARK